MPHSGRRVEAARDGRVGGGKGGGVAGQGQQRRGAARRQLGRGGGDVGVVVPRQQAQLPERRRQRTGLWQQ